MYAALLTVALTYMTFTSCSGRTEPLDLEIIRAFETGAIKISIELESQFDGHSILYRAFVTERSAESALSEETLFDLDRFDYSWTVDEARYGNISEQYIAFSDSGRHRLSVTLSLDGRLLATARKIVETDGIGAREAGEIVYLSLPETRAHFAVPGRIVSDVSDTGLVEVVNGGGTTVLRADVAGFFFVTSVDEEDTFNTNVFVSPVPTYHVDRTDRDWYYTQFRTFTTSNCGPSVVSMGISWAKGAEVPVSTVRSHVGWTGSGAVNMSELKSVLDIYDVSSRLHWVETPDEIFAMLDAGNLVGVVYDMAGISFTENAADNLFGQYYIDAGGHYLMLKGYSLDRKYFVVYDPIPSDWTENAGRYGDGASMYGRNRYYDVEELFESLRSRQILEIVG